MGHSGVVLWSHHPVRSLLLPVNQIKMSTPNTGVLRLKLINSLAAFDIYRRLFDYDHWLPRGSLNAITFFHVSALKDQSKCFKTNWQYNELITFNAEA